MSRFCTIIFVLCFSLIHLNAQSTEGFWGLEYGMTQAQVETTQIKATSIEKDENAFYLNGISFGGISFDSGLLAFYKNQLYSGFFETTVPAEKAASVATQIAKGIAEKHGSAMSLKEENALFWVTKEENFILLSLNFEKDDPSIALTYTCEKIRIQKEEDEKSDF